MQSGVDTASPARRPAGASPLILCAAGLWVSAHLPGGGVKVPGGMAHAGRFSLLTLMVLTFAGPTDRRARSWRCEPSVRSAAAVSMMGQILHKPARTSSTVDGSLVMGRNGE